jgi:hypothetical protein
VWVEHLIVSGQSLDSKTYILTKNHEWNKHSSLLCRGVECRNNKVVWDWHFVKYFFFFVLANYLSMFVISHLRAGILQTSYNLSLCKRMIIRSSRKVWRISPLKCEMTKFGMTENDRCIRCFDKDTITHLPNEYEYSKWYV